MASNLFLRNAPIGPDRNLCFTNAALQLLRNIPEFKLKMEEHILFSPVHKEICNILDKEGSDFSTSAHSVRQKVGEFHNIDELYSGEQNDTMEFLEYLLQSIHPEISSLFFFNIVAKKQFLVNELPSRCQKCFQNPKEMNDTQLSLKVSFPQNIHLYKNGMTLQQLIDKHFEAKLMGQEMRCKTCCTRAHNSTGKHTNLCKPKPFQVTEHVTKHPKYLLLQLMRFEQTTHGLHKIETLIKDIGFITIQETKYEVVSIINHHGNVDGGHYTAFLKSNNCWYHYDDIKKTTCRSDTSVENDNYVYLLKKVITVSENVNEEWIPTNEWQEVPPGIQVPAGLEHWWDMTTGERKARLLQKNSKTSSEFNVHSHDENENLTNDVQNTLKSTKKLQTFDSQSWKESVQAIKDNSAIPIYFMDIACNNLKNKANIQQISGFYPPSEIKNLLSKNIKRLPDNH